jgi:cytochrome c oxidase cbb3-type subunit 3/ubiquinol-cytochrome c reductase cytochrome c subunit
VDVVHAALTKKAKLAILDARASSDYLNEHIGGSVSVPFYDAERYLPDLPKDAWLVAYCACPHAESGKLAKLLIDKGFKKVTVLDEGIGVWKRKGYPIAKGEKPWSDPAAVPSAASSAAR